VGLKGEFSGEVQFATISNETHSAAGKARARSYQLKKAPVEAGASGLSTLGTDNTREASVGGLRNPLPENIKFALAAGAMPIGLACPARAAGAILAMDGLGRTLVAFKHFLAPLRRGFLWQLSSEPARRVTSEPRWRFGNARASHRPARPGLEPRHLRQLNLARALQ